jgi:hypothetical protein
VKAASKKIEPDAHATPPSPMSQATIGDMNRSHETRARATNNTSTRTVGIQHGCSRPALAKTLSLYNLQTQITITAARRGMLSHAAVDPLHHRSTSLSY